MISAYIWNYFPHLQKSVDSNTSFIKNLSSSRINLMALKLFLLIEYFFQMQDFVKTQYMKLI